MVEEGGGRSLNSYPAALVVNYARTYFGATFVTSIEYTEL